MMNQDLKTIHSHKPTYWVRSKQTDEKNLLRPTPAPRRFRTLAAAERRRRELNLVRGPYHPGYFVEVREDRSFSMTTGSVAASS